MRGAGLRAARVALTVPLALLIGSSAGLSVRSSEPAPSTARSTTAYDAAVTLAAVDDAAWRRGPGAAQRPGRLLSRRPAGETSRVDGARRALEVRYSTTDRRGRVAQASGLVLLPAQRRADAPLVVYGHMTTGAADACAPTRGTPDSTELRRMQQGDRVAELLLAGGAVVARPDYEGLGVRGPHPYLRGDSLARAMGDMARAVRRAFPEVGRDWVAAGHSEGGVAALNTGSRTGPAADVPGLLGVAAITPVTQVDVLATLLGDAPVGAPPVNVVVSLAALILKGQATEDRALRRLLLKQGGLSPEAVALWPDLERLCLEDLGGTDSWGGLSPQEVKGPRGDEALEEMKNGLRADDVRHLRMRLALPIRIDAGALDSVAPLPFTMQLAEEYRSRGYPVELAVWPAEHSPTADQAASELAAWILDLFDHTTGGPR